jgi:hypothetical protein
MKTISAVEMNDKLLEKLIIVDKPMSFDDPSFDKLKSHVTYADMTTGPFTQEIFDALQEAAGMNGPFVIVAQKQLDFIYEDLYKLCIDTKVSFSEVLENSESTLTKNNTNNRLDMIMLVLDNYVSNDLRKNLKEKYKQ